MDQRTLTESNRLHLQRLLRAQQALLIQEAEQLESTTGVAPETQGDAAVVEGERATDLALLADETAVLREVVAALERMREGTYGRCVTCGRSIPRVRLAVIPYARRCTGCQTQHE